VFVISTEDFLAKIEGLGLHGAHTRPWLPSIQLQTALGRPQGSLSKKTKLTGREAEIQRLLEKKVAVSAIARLMGVHRLTMAHCIKSRHLAVR
jgi:hypothetical protein